MKSPAAAQSADLTYMRIESEPGDTIGGGGSFEFLPEDGSFEAIAHLDVSTDVDSLVLGIDFPSYERWRFIMYAPIDTPIGIGPYEDAGQRLDGTLVKPRLYVNNTEGMCDALDVVGRFEVLELAVSADGDVEHMAVDVDAYCGTTDAPALHAELRFHATSESYPAAPDDDNDGIPNTMDSCPLTPSPVTSDVDGDRVADPCDPEFTVTYSYYYEGPGPTGSLLVRPAEAYLVAAADSSEVDVQYMDGTERCSVGFRAPSGQVLAPGVYEGARSDSDTTTPGLAVWCGSTDFSSPIYGRFVIHELEVVDGEPVRFSADFEVGPSEQVQTGSHGSVRINASNDPVAVSGVAKVDGAGKAGVLVEAVAQGTDTVIGSATTGAGGSYSIDMPPTPVDLRASASGIVPQWHDGHVYRELTSLVPVGWDGLTGVDVSVRSGGVLIGKISPEGDEPLHWAGLLLYDLEGNQLTERWDIRTFDLDDVHYYEVFGEPSGEYKIAAIPAIWNDEWPYATTWYPAASDFLGAAPVTLRNGELTVADIGVVPAAKLKVGVWSWDANIKFPYHAVLNLRDVTNTGAVLLSDTEWALAPGTWYVFAADYDPENNVIWNVFPAWYPSAPELRLDLAEPFVVESGDSVSAFFHLDGLYPDMFDTVFIGDIAWLQATGITRGCDGGSRFCTDDPVTRGQMAAFLVRALGLNRTGSVDFVDDDDSVFETDIEKLAAAGITKGCNRPVNDRVLSR